LVTKTKAQIHMEDRMVSNSELLALLEERETLKEGATAYRDKDKATKNAIIALGEEPPYRIGRFIITRKEHQARHVDFDIQAGASVKIARADEE
jgi:hypothetical protein